MVKDKKQKQAERKARKQQANSGESKRAVDIPF